MFFKKILREVLPHGIVKRIQRHHGFRSESHNEKYGWSGDYLNWESARNASTGYSRPEIVRKTLASARLVRDGKAAFERDSFVFEAPDYNWPLLSALMHVAAVKHGRLRVVDIGGALGSTYFQNKPFLRWLDGVEWRVVEQKGYVEIGRREFENSQLSFYDSLEESLTKEPDAILLSSVLQYLEKPYEYLGQVVSHGAPYLIIDRTGFTLDDKDRLTVQNVPPWIYPASYPCWFMSRSKLLDILNPQYEVLVEFDALDKANIAAKYGGFLLRKR